MRNESHSITLIGTLRTAIVEWRKREGWSREAVVQVIVEAHEHMSAPAATGIVFDPNTRDTFERAKVNADRVFRWLDDESKDNNLLPANFIPSILAAMPADIRLHCLDAILRPLGVAVSGLDAAAPADFDATPHLSAMIKEGAEAHIALVGVKPGAPLAVLVAARKEVGDVAESTSRAGRALDAAIAAATSGTPKVLHRA